MAIFTSKTKMGAEESNTRKRVSVSQLKPGVYVVDLDRSWFQTRFYFHRRLIKHAKDIETLKKHGIREVVIDTARGADVEAPLPDPLPEIAAAVPSADERAAEKRPPSSAEIALQPLTKELEAARTIHAEAMAVAQNIFEGVASGSPVNSPAAKKVVTDLLGSITRSPEANLLLTQMRRFQNDLFAHAVNVCVLCLVIGTLEEFESEISALGLGALLHDVGKTRLPRNLIRRKEPYTESERQILQQHPKLGAVLLEPSENIPELTHRIVVEHHERIDGLGYPLGAEARQISPFSQIVAITDAYDDMLTGRKHAPLQPLEVLRQLYLLGNAGAFDCALVERIIRCLGVYPAGSLVELNTGERGIVIAANRKDSLKPTLRIISSRDGLALSNGPILSLLDTDTGSIERRIIRALDPGKERVNPLAYLKLTPAFSG
jgi:HD-GYP domain-containing protein (c-di-GMP phosphodiesterase class II)